MGFLEERDLSDVPSIPDYYKGKTIFITGGSGFMGKVLVEKLLYSCSDLDRIYLLLRSKKGVKPEDRLLELYKSRCFDRLRKEKPDIFENKVFFISGDCSEIGLGISDEDRTLLLNRTQIIFHVAASVRFDDSLKVAANLNLRGTCEMIELAKHIRNLEVLVHVSTSYANTNRARIDEVIYPAFADWRDTLEICEKLDENTLRVLTPKYLGELPNTYVFTKQLAEHVMWEQKGKLPIIIMRPSIVISSVSEPVAGWVENLNGPVGMLIASGKGILRTLYTDPDLVSDYIPVDVAIKAFIAGAWIRGTKKFEPTDDIEVYNCSTSHIKTMTMGEVVEFGRNIVKEIPIEGMLWSAGGCLTTSRLEFNLRVFFLHLLPALLVDMLLWISGNKPMLVKLQRRIYSANLALHYYVTQQWTFTNTNILELRKKIKALDRNSFYYEMEKINQEDYFRNACIGGKKYILKEKMENLPKAKAHMKRMQLLDFVVRNAFLGYLFWFVINTDFVMGILKSCDTAMTFLEERNFNDVASIPAYYKGKTIFMTGGSGFMGKVLLEKLLYSCTDLDRIYLLLRNKKGVAPEQRLAEIYKSHCFDRLRIDKPGIFESKVFFIAGDCSEIGLGISDEDRALIINRTQIIFHVAASVRFDDTLKVAAKLNLRGTKEMLELATEVRNLEAFAHISTSYANTNRDPVEEVMYPPLADWRDTLKICEEADDMTIQVLTAKYLGEMPNTYVFTKQLAENVVYEYRGKLPIVIIRPSIVISSVSEPTPGWIENFNGPTGLIVACGKGILRTLYSKPDLISDYIPVDVAIKCFIAAAWARGTKKLELSDDIPIYNSCAGKLNSITVYELIEIGEQVIAEEPLHNSLWTYGPTITTSLFLYNLQVLFLHLLPAVLVDVLLWLLGKKTMLVKIQRRIYAGNVAVQYYLNQQWTFTNTNFISLRSIIKEVDQEDFYYDIENIDRYEFFRRCCFIGRKYLLRESEADAPKNKAHYARLKFLSKLLKCIFYGFIFWLVMRTEFVQNRFAPEK
ncbi:unnamed protein product, partial [Brenthis ino]